MTAALRTISQLVDDVDTALVDAIPDACNAGSWSEIGVALSALVKSTASSCRP